MTPEQIQRVQIIEHRMRLLKDRLEVKERAIKQLVNENGPIRCELQTLENEKHRIFARIVA